MKKFIRKSPIFVQVDTYKVIVKEFYPYSIIRYEKWFKDKKEAESYMDMKLKLGGNVKCIMK